MLPQTLVCKSKKKKKNKLEKCRWKLQSVCQWMKCKRCADGKAISISENKARKAKNHRPHLGNQTWLKRTSVVVVALPVPEGRETRRNMHTHTHSDVRAYFFVSLPLLKCYLWIFIRWVIHTHTHTRIHTYVCRHKLATSHRSMRKG